MPKIIATLLVLFAVGSASADDVILRASSDCCGSDSSFRAGSRAILFEESKVRAESELDADSYFVFESVDEGKYDLAISAVGYFPEKFAGLEIGKDGVFDFELVRELQPISGTPILEGHIILRFRKTLSDEDIMERLGDLSFGVLQVARREGESEVKHRIDRMYDYAEVRATYDRSEDISDLIWEALKDPTVVDCSPVYFSAGH